MICSTKKSERFEIYMFPGSECSDSVKTFFVPNSLPGILCGMCLSFLFINLYDSDACPENKTRPLHLEVQLSFRSIIGLVRSSGPPKEKPSEWDKKVSKNRNTTVKFPFLKTLQHLHAHTRTRTHTRAHTHTHTHTHTHVYARTRCALFHAGEITWLYNL